MRWKSTGLFVGNALKYMYPKHLPSLHLSRDKKSSMTTEHGNANNEEEIGHTECLIIGAGVVGCAVSRALALQGREVLMLDMHNSLGFETSSRNSEVVHAGIYYPPGSAKARLCVDGRRRLYDFCEANNVPFRRLGKLIVATSVREEGKLLALQRQAQDNGVEDLRLLTARQAREMEPSLRCTAALHSPSTGIVDSHSLMVALLAHAEEAGAVFSGNSRVVSGEVLRRGGGPRAFSLDVEDCGSGEVSRLTADAVVNAAGLHAQDAAARIAGIPPEAVPARHLARGCYFVPSVRAPFSRLIYPVPEDGGLGVHLTLDMAGSARFGPDVEWVSVIDYRVDAARASAFYGAIRKYYPDLPDSCLQPDYAGIRPKVSGPGEPPGDFVISGPEAHGIAGLVNLFGIESPGLTASLAIAEEVVSLL